MILKTKYADGTIHFKDLGEDFILIEKGINNERFDETAKVHFKGSVDHFIKDTIGFVVYDRGKIEPLYTDFNHYILNNSGGLLIDLAR